MKLIQKSFLQQLTLEIKGSNTLEYTAKRIFKKVNRRIPIQDIYIDKMYHRHHLDAMLFTVILISSLSAITLLLTRFRVYSNEDLFVVMCGIIMILAIAYRTLQSKYKIQIVIPTSGQGEILLDPDKPSKEKIEFFIMRLEALILIESEGRTSIK